MSRIIRLGPGACPDAETGARYFAALAFPGADEDTARQDAVTAWAGSYLREANRVDESDMPFVDDRLNAFASLDAKWCKQKLRTTWRRLRDRCLAARAVRPWVREILGGSHRPVPGVSKFSQRQIALYLCHANPEQAAKFQKRIWRPSRPVLHLAIAQDQLLCALEEDCSDYKINLADVEAIGKMVACTRDLEAYIMSDPRFGIGCEDIIHLEWIS